MRPALYWVIRFEGGGYEHGTTRGIPPVRTPHRVYARRYFRPSVAKCQARRYRATGRPCRIVRVVRKEPAK